MADTPGLDVINLALSHLGQTAITQTQLNDNSTVGTEAALRVWELALRETLRSSNWSFAKVKVALTLVESTTYDPANYTYAYEYPTNCVAIRKVNVQTSIDEAISEEYEIEYDTTNEAKRIVTDVEDAYIEYTYYISDTDLWDSAFIVSFSYYLAALLAKPLNGDDAQAKDMIALFTNSISNTKRYNDNSKKETHDANESSAFVDARG